MSPIKRRRAPASAGLAIAATMLASVLGASPATATAEPLAHAGRWITDAQGRVAILHGLNMVSKLPPYLPSDQGFGRDDARFLRRNGFNTIRLGVIYGGVEPEPGDYDRAYLRDLARTQRTLSREGIQTLVDMHQDLYNERFGGEGWPDWAVTDDGLPAIPDVGFPGNYPAMAALNRAFDNFWANAEGPGGVGLMDRYARAWRRVAETFRREDRVMGYDVMNEPWPGSVWPSCAQPVGCQAFDQGPLETMHKKAIDQIRMVDRRHTVWYEPQLLFNFGSDSSHPSPDPNAGFSFHNYCLADALGVLFAEGNPLGNESCSTMEDLVFTNADAQARQTDDALLLSEFGATDDLDVIRRIVDGADRSMVSWQEWHYCDCQDPTTSGPGVQSLVVDPSRPPRGDNVKRDKLRVLARPYPQRVAGTPRNWHFTERARRFDFSFKPVPAGKRLRSRQTTIAAPRIQYPQGRYRVAVDGVRVISRPRARTLRLETCRRGHDPVSVVVEPGTGVRERGCGPGS